MPAPAPACSASRGCSFRRIPDSARPSARWPPTGGSTASGPSSAARPISTSTAIAERLEALTAAALAELRDGRVHRRAGPAAQHRHALRRPELRARGPAAGRSVHRRGGRGDGGRFGRAHDEFYGFSLEGEPVEFVNLRVSAIGPTDLAAVGAAPDQRQEAEPSRLASRVISRSGLSRNAGLPAGDCSGLASPSPGPAIIEEPDATTVVHPGDTLVVRPDGLLGAACQSDVDDRGDGDRDARSSRWRSTPSRSTSSTTR